MDPPRTILATDCGSTTTKAILITRGEDGWRLAGRGEAPTTVEEPFNDVTIGVRNAVTELSEVTGRRLIDADGRFVTPAVGRDGVDLYLTTSSAGGGLQMLVVGIVRAMSAESGERAALCAGAVVMDVIALNDGRSLEQRIERIRTLRPDIVLLTGGTDGGTVRHVAQLAELIAAARPRPRVGESGRLLPLVYAGNRAAAALVRERLSSVVAMWDVDNLRPTLEHENLGPARDRIHELFMEHVMAQAPGYDRLRQMTPVPVMPTPAAVGAMIQTAASRRAANVLGVDIGGATTDVFSVVDGRFTRTVSANLGMSYSASTVLASAGVENVLRWLPGGGDERALRDGIRNKMVRPTTVPQTVADLRLEHALAREAMRLSFEQHARFAQGLRGGRREHMIGDALAQAAVADALDPMQVDLLIGSGGVLSHAPRRAQAMLMLIDSFQPCGVTRLAVDSIFMMPHLGVLSMRLPDAALEVFERDCLVPLGTVVAPRGRARRNRPLCRIEFHGAAGAAAAAAELHPGELLCRPCAAGQPVRARLRPDRQVDVGAGPGEVVEAELTGGEVGLVFDGRGRPLHWADDPAARRADAARWAAAMSAYPE